MADDITFFPVDSRLRPFVKDELLFCETDPPTMDISDCVQRIGFVAYNDPERTFYEELMRDLNILADALDVMDNQEHLSRDIIDKVSAFMDNISHAVDVYSEPTSSAVDKHCLPLRSEIHVGLVTKMDFLKMLDPSGFQAQFDVVKYRAFLFEKDTNLAVYVLNVENRTWYKIPLTQPTRKISIKQLHQRLGWSIVARPLVETGKKEPVVPEDFQRVSKLNDISVNTQDVPSIVRLQAVVNPVPSEKTLPRTPKATCRTSGDANLLRICFHAHPEFGPIDDVEIVERDFACDVTIGQVAEFVRQTFGPQRQLFDFAYDPDQPLRSIPETLKMFDFKTRQYILNDIERR